jgi:hypothetical protein
LSVTAWTPVKAILAILAVFTGDYNRFGISIGINLRRVVAGSKNGTSC